MVGELVEGRLGSDHPAGSSGPVQPAGLRCLICTTPQIQPFSLLRIWEGDRSCSPAAPWGRKFGMDGAVEGTYAPAGRRDSQVCGNQAKGLMCT